jgi:hypothetical protein
MQALQFEVLLRNVGTFGVVKSDTHQKAWVLAENARDLEFEIAGFDTLGKTYPGMVVELFVDGVLRNIIKLRTGRGLGPNQFGEAVIDRGVIMTETGDIIMKKFRFIDLDLDDCMYRQTNH